MVQPTDFREFALCQKTLELIERYGLTPMDIRVQMYLPLGSDGLHHWKVDWHDEMPAERLEKVMERMQRLHSDLDIEATDGEIIVEDQLDLYNMLCDAIAKAPKSFTRSR